jgi:hypothetical protein
MNEKSMDQDNNERSDHQGYIAYRMFHFKTITFVGIKKQKMSAFLVFRKYRLKTIYSGTNFSSILDFRLILIHSITPQ